jgi:hypothetical protein
MKFLTTLFALAILSATAYGQTIKALGYDTASGEVVANTGTNVLTFTNEVIVADNIELSSLTLGAGAQLNIDALNVQQQKFFIDAGATEIEAGIPINFTGEGATTNAAITRTNLGLGGGVITNIDVLVSGGGTNTLQFSNGILTNVTTP